MACHIRKDDIVEVIAGDHKGQRGKVLRLNPKRELVVVEGVNMVYRHVRPSRRNPQGGRVQREAPIHISNLLPYDPKADKGSRVRFEVERDKEGKATGKKRVCVRSGTVLNTVSRAEKTA
jgi:large subunit ribosomal protein L24